MRKGRALFLSVLLPAVLLCGCGRGEATETTISAEKDGKIVQKIREASGENLSDMEDIEAYINDQVEEYNSTRSEDAPLITVQKCEQDEETGQISVDIEYPTYQDYEDFNDRTLFWGTVTEAASAGYPIATTSFSNPDGEAMAGVDVITEYGDKKILILEEPVQVWTSGRIQEVSSGVEIVDNDTAEVKADSGDTEVTSGLNYIVFN